jgi:aminoglycoside phosphotransferase (APT) family kinase protein
MAAGVGRRRGRAARGGDHAASRPAAAGAAAGDVDFAAQRRASGSSALLDAAEQRLQQTPMPQGMSLFVHGDLWQGNTLWAGEACTGMVDWDAAGVGHPGIDLGSLLCDAAIMFGLPAAGEILEGWRQRQGSGQAADTAAYWNLVAALTTPTDMARWLPVARDHGRVDLDAATLNRRRDEFLRAALDQLDRQESR